MLQPNEKLIHCGIVWVILFIHPIGVEIIAKIKLPLQRKKKWWMAVERKAANILELFDLLKASLNAFGINLYGKRRPWFCIKTRWSSSITCGSYFSTVKMNKNDWTLSGPLPSRFSWCGLYASILSNEFLSPSFQFFCSKTCCDTRLWILTDARCRPTTAHSGA